MCKLKNIFTVLICVVLLFSGCSKPPENDNQGTGNTDKTQIVERKTPIMGWSSWNVFGAESLSYDNLVKQMDALVSTGLKDAGYVYFNIDDGYQMGRDSKTGRIRIHTRKFPNGEADLKNIVDLAHSKGLYAGIYTDAGDNTCASGNKIVTGINVGLWRYENDDLHRFLGNGTYRDAYAKNNPEDEGVECFGFDFIKVDWCGGAHAGLNQENQYTKIGNIIKEIEQEYSKDKIYNICCWAYKGEWQLQADSWRIGGDIHAGGKNFDSVLVQVDNIKSISHLTSPGHVNDPDMMVVGKGLTQYEDETHFALWCMFSAPLVLGCDLTTIRPETLELVTNEELIAINQDPACISASYKGNTGDNVEVWVKPLGSAESDTKALALFNRSEKEQTITYNLSEIGYTDSVAVRDLFAHADLSATKQITVTLQPHQTAVFKLNSTDNISRKSGTAEPLQNDSEYENIDCETARRLVENGAVLLDVRTKEEYDEKHLSGAKNILYTEVITKAENLFPDKSKPIICYCSTFKRSFQAYTTLKSLGYTNVYNLGAMGNYEK